MYVNGVDQGHINGIRVPTYDGVRFALHPSIDFSDTLLFHYPARHGCNI